MLFQKQPEFEPDDAPKLFLALGVAYEYLCYLGSYQLPYSITKLSYLQAALSIQDNV